MPRPTDPDKLKKDNGQILIEAVFGVALVATVLVVLVSLSLRSLRVQVLNKQWQQTDSLEQESLEAIRQIRDGYGSIRFFDTETSSTIETAWDWVDPDIWDASGTSHFRLYYDTLQGKWIMDQTAETSPVDTAYRLYWDTVSRSYGYPGRGGFPASATASPFYRQLVFTETAESPASRAVSCILSWNDRNTPHQSKVVSLFSRW
ncbi:hypothetical protein AUK40_06650 [Candidatus Wirthbacteria bacterium CG2_30_54_11]|uniref:Type 4 fimbrial biogenesis protein PilX N-terminal domain-containing protein n=1 Tax=Candidatus Wirthbacteria bacterium CG2_30_54_11 TaxID=1817892 RepID=A0A1J5IR89_9BACT|nr:MAG: hypothetical protein AUK40_06650 [Candidatus Wirthbacteria bacterium CG2_30_54_11]